MVFPTTAVPVVVEIAPGGNPAGDPGDWTWSDITTSVRLQDRIELVTGRQNEASSVDPGRCTMRLDNSTGDFTPRNPSGQWYGQLARNTPLRVSVLRVEDAFARTSTAGWGTADSGQVWTDFGAGGAVATTDFTVSGGQARHFVPVALAYRGSWLSAVSLLDVEVVLTMDTFIANVAGAAIEPAGILLRMQDSSTYYMARVEIDAAEAVTIKLYHSTVGLLASASVPSITWAGQPMRVRAAIVADRLSAKVWDPAGSEPAGWQVDVTDETLTAPGGVGIRSGVAAGNTNTMPVEFRYDDLEVLVPRFCGFVSSWPPRWDKSGNNATVPIQADGVLRRLGQGTPPSRSALRRTIGGSAPSAYWPAEDGVSAGQAASAIAGHSPLTVSGTVEFKTVEVLPYNTATVRYGTSALADLAAGGRMFAPLPGDVATATSAVWTLHTLAKADPTTLSANMVLLEWTTPGGTYVRWQLVLTTATHTQVIAYTSAGASTVVVDRVGVVDSFTTWAVTAEQVGGLINVSYWLTPTIPITGSVAGTLAGVTSMSVNPTGASASIETPVGHLAVWATTSVPYPTEPAADSYGEFVFEALRSHLDEAATDRLVRLAAEDGATLTMPALTDALSVTRMGWQPAGSPLDLYRQCEAADHGVLYESGFGLGYLPREGRYNRTVALALDFDAGQVAAPPEPVDDDQQLRNRVTVRRTDGSGATAEDTTSIAAVGTYETSVDRNLAADGPLADHASWLVHEGTVDEMRWPRIDVNLARSPELIDAVLSCGVQSRVTLSNPPPAVAGDTIDVIVEGWSETIGYKDWQLSLNTSPAAGWTVAEVDGDARVPADGSTLAASLTSTALSLSLASTAANGVWTTNPADFPLDLRVGGEQVTVSAITGTTSPQPAAISARSVNGVVKAWPAGTEVDVWTPAIAAL